MLKLEKFVDNWVLAEVAYDWYETKNIKTPVNF